MSFGHWLAELASKPPTWDTKQLYKDLLELGYKEATKRAVIAMMTENTGCHVLDSGGAYGRNFEKNREIDDWDNIPYHKIHWCGQDDWYIQKNLFPYLTKYLLYDVKLDALFHTYADMEDYKEMQWKDVVDQFLEDVHMLPNGWKWENTASFEDLLSQTILYRGYASHSAYPTGVVLRIHGGCDTRGGYTTPHFFHAIEGFDAFIIGMSDIGLECSNCDYINHWSDDCGYHWYYDGSTLIPDPEARERINELLYDEDKETFLCPICKHGVDVYG